MGKCPECGQWNSFEEQLVVEIKKSNSSHGISINNSPQIVTEIETEKLFRVKTNIGEFDRVVGGGLVIGSLTLIGGEPGIGKSTLLTEVIGKIAFFNKDEKVLYISGEESVSQIANRVKRLNIGSDNLYLLHETNWQTIQEQIESIRPQYVVLDSIQTTVSSEVSASSGSVSQIREVTYELMNLCKSKGITSFVIGHITKQGVIAGPKILEHMVDTVIYFEGDQYGYYRILRVIKNRFGNTDEVGIFEMSDKGLKEVPNPSQYFLESTLEGAFGRSLTCIMEGSRSLFVEIQALVVENKGGNGRRTTQGIDNNRLAMLLAVIEKYFGIPLSFTDVYVNIVGGIRLQNRESDLSILASILSSYKSRPIDNSKIFIGEVGLTGEVRAVPRIEMRIKEMAQLNYKTLVTAKKTAQEYKGKYGIEIIGIERALELDKLL